MVGHRPIDPTTGAATAAAGQVQVSVESAVAALDPRRWELVVAEERPRPFASTGVDTVNTCATPVLMLWTKCRAPFSHGSFDGFMASRAEWHGGWKRSPDALRALGARRRSSSSPVARSTAHHPRPNVGPSILIPGKRAMPTRAYVHVAADVPRSSQTPDVAMPLRSTARLYRGALRTVP